MGIDFSGIKFEDPNFITNPYEKWTAYGQSKTANSLFTVHWNKVGEKYGVRAFRVHPARITSTDLSWFMLDEEIAATADRTPANPKFDNFLESIFQEQQLFWCATSPQLENKGGVYCAGKEDDLKPITK